MIKVVHIQTHLPTSGNAAYRLHEALVMQGVDSKMLMLTSAMPKNAKIDHLSTKAQLKSLINSKFHNRYNTNVLAEFGLFSLPMVGNDISNHEFVKNADVIYLHWILAGLLNFSGMEKLFKLGKPVIMFMHDMWAITGGCHHSFTCEKFMSKCTACPMFNEAEKNNYASKGFNKKLMLYDDYDNVYFVSPSKWLYGLATKSALTKNKPVFHIPNLVTDSIFKPFDTKMARRVLNLDENATLIAFGAISPTSPYKGWKYLKEALDILAANAKFTHVNIVVFGCEHDARLAETIPFKTAFVGRLNDEYSAALVYNAVDLFVAPSLAETFGLVLLEALRCNTPVVAFETGGIPDIVEHKKNGYLAEYRNGADLAMGIAYCLENKLSPKAPNSLDSSVVVQQHIDLLTKLSPKP